ncbi:predicted protein [Naegleria gruberi]|uniref:Predicted protein n=1 Tax=Naegleria gruberi TaxID=5762 RepID=D2VW40_NAEGR|nr:uncharacterized protein NAEGRDRAFT_73239 [Naegleria gruberi]EFC39012.1 predicted protein [Naegleria gruberi]|eukprot:XP_002671756.1 predicted protein [Naegleria gruberi strain NEG-M]
MSVKVELIDFLPSQFTSTDDDHHDNNNLINLLKYKINIIPTKRYSLEFSSLNVSGYYSAWHVGPNCFDIVLSNDYYRFIVTNGSALSVFPRAETAEEYENKSIGRKALFEVEFEEITCFNCLKLIKEKDEEYIYASTDPYVVKIKVSDIMRKNPLLVWKSKETYYNIWGLDVMGSQLYVVDYEKSVMILDREHGDHLQYLDDDIGKIEGGGFGIHCFSENEILMSHNSCLELFEKQQGKWNSIRKSSFRMNFAYSIFYEKASDLIYVSDNGGYRLVVVRREDLSKVKSVSGNYKSFGIIIDPLSGLLYVCDSGQFGVLIYS